MSYFSKWNSCGNNLFIFICLFDWLFDVYSISSWGLSKICHRVCHSRTGALWRFRLASVCTVFKPQYHQRIFFSFLLSLLTKLALPPQGSGVQGDWFQGSHPHLSVPFQQRCLVSVTCPLSSCRVWHIPNVPRGSSCSKNTYCLSVIYPSSETSGVSQVLCVYLHLCVTGMLGKLTA